MTKAADGSSPPAAAWQPLTFGGVAAFASARLGRLLLIGFIAAAVFGAAFVWFLQRDYCPVVLEAIQKMPDNARVSGGKLQGVTNSLISESKLLAIAVTPETATDIGQGADVQFQLRQTDFCVVSIFRPDWGLDFDFDRGSSLNLSRAALEPWWGAWQPVLLAGAGLAAAIALLASWVVLAALYMAPAKFAAWFADRNLSWMGAGRLCFAAMTPGALVMTFAVFLYGLQAVDLVHLSVFWAVHLVIGWVYVGGGVWSLPRLFPRVTEKNPFAAGP
jgi:hypothetical protein